MHSKGGKPRLRDKAFPARRGSRVSLLGIDGDLRKSVKEPGSQQASARTCRVCVRFHGQCFHEAVMRVWAKVNPDAMSSR